MCDTRPLPFNTLHYIFFSQNCLCYPHFFYNYFIPYFNFLGVTAHLLQQFFFL